MPSRKVTGASGTEPTADSMWSPKTIFPSPLGDSYALDPAFPLMLVVDPSYCRVDALQIHRVGSTEALKAAYW